MVKGCVDIYWVQHGGESPAAFLPSAMVTVVRGSFKRALARAGLPHATRFHDLRHTCATVMLANGVDIPVVAAILGHARINTTVDIYWHALPARLSAATDVIQLAIRGSGALAAGSGGAPCQVR